mmetsp:Transcript_24185/g.50436  ORF Transcript_24185/g.50436 Transcript_24185/m.50436 type:complete len:200 (-) Transcript_24185:347-946(-)
MKHLGIFLWLLVISNPILLESTSLLDVVLPLFPPFPLLDLLHCPQVVFLSPLLNNLCKRKKQLQKTFGTLANWQIADSFYSQSWYFVVVSHCQELPHTTAISILLVFLDPVFPLVLHGTVTLILLHFTPDYGLCILLPPLSLLHPLGEVDLDFFLHPGLGPTALCFDLLFNHSPVPWPHPWGPKHCRAVLIESNLIYSK